MDNFYCVKDNTWCIDTGYALIGVYKLNDRDVILIDSGTAYMLNEAEKILPVLEENRFNVKAVICTHGHWDHIGNNEILRKKYKCKIYMYGEEAYSSISENGIIFTRMLLPYNEEMKKTFSYMTTHVDEFISHDAKYILVCGRRFDIIHTPGHSVSHISVITEDNVCVVGDVIMTENEITKTKIPYACNFGIDFASKRKLLELDCDKYIIAHRGVRNDIKDEVEANINYLKYRADVVLSYIEDGMCYDEIAAAVINCMNIKIHSRFIFSDIHGMIMPYVQYLEESGKIEARYEKGYMRYYVTDYHDEE